MNDDKPVPSAESGMKPPDDFRTFMRNYQDMVFSTSVRLLADAAALLNPITWREPFGMAMLEAQACGTPVVAARVGGLPTAVADGVSGILVDGHDPDVWAGALCEAVAHPASLQRMAQAAGFRFESASEINANPKDTKDYAEGVWTLPPSLAAAATASSTVKHGMPRGVVTPYLRRSSFA